MSGDEVREVSEGALDHLIEELERASGLSARRRHLIKAYAAQQVEAAVREEREGCAVATLLQRPGEPLRSGNRELPRDAACVALERAAAAIRARGSAR